MTTIKYALQYTGMGLYVFPLSARSKKPPKGFAWREQSSNDPNKIYTWAKTYPLCNWAVDCGKSNLIVLDEDNKNGKCGADALLELEDTYGSIHATDTLMIGTPTGGVHYYYRGLSRSSVDKIAVGLDIKSFGGYVVAPGSQVDDGAYEILRYCDIAKVPDWLSGLAGEASMLAHNDVPLIDLDIPLNIRRATQYLTTEAPLAVEFSGGDDNAYKVACRVRDEGISESVALELLLQHWYPRCTPNNVPQFVMLKVRNAYNYGQNQPGAKSVLLPYNDTAGTIPDDYKEIAANRAEAQVEKKSSSLSDIIITADKFAKIEFPKLSYYLHPWLTTQSISMIYGGAGLGKSWLVLSILKAIVDKEDLGPWRFVNTAPVLYLDAEMTGIDVQERIDSLRVKNRSQYYIYSDAYGCDKGIPKANVLDKTWRKAMEDLIISFGIKICALDNLMSLMPAGDENTKADWDPINQWMLRLRYLGVSTILLHHTGKSGDQRGTSSRIGNINHSIKLTKPKDYAREDGARFNVAFEKARIKQKDLKYIADIQMRLEVDEASEQSRWVFTRPGLNRKFDILKCKAEGLSNKEIAKTLECTASNVSKWVSKLKSDHYLDSDGQLTAAGLGSLLNAAGKDPDLDTYDDVQ